MNNKIEQKKEYFKPQMTAVEIEHRELLCDSSGGDDSFCVEFKDG